MTITYYKSVRLNGTDFHTGGLQWAPPEGHEAPWIVYHPSGCQEVPSTHPRDFLSVATVPTDCSGMVWPCRLLQVRPVEGHPVATPGRKLFPNRASATAWEVVAELDPRLALGPQADQLIALFDTAGRLTGGKLRDLAAAWNAARNAARTAARTAARDAARTAAWYAAWALVVRDLLPQEHYETLTRPWASVIGKVHPDDEDLRVNAAIEWSRWDEGGPTSLPPDLTPSLLPAARLCCADHPHGLICTRLPGHTGRHAAGDGDFIVAVWGDPA